MELICTSEFFKKLKLHEPLRLVLEQPENALNAKGQVTQGETALCEWAENLNNLSALLSTSLIAIIIIVTVLYASPVFGVRVRVRSYKLLMCLIVSSVFCKLVQSLLICSLVPI